MSAADCQTPAVALPPLDTVLLWLTYTTERDLDRRGAFPELREANAHGHRGSASLHFLTPARAAELLEEAAALAKTLPRGIRASYRGCAQELQLAIAEATARPAFQQQAMCRLRSDYLEDWAGTKADLRRQLGIADGGRPWPGEPGATRWFKSTDARGFFCNVTRYSSLWPCLFSVEVRKSRAPAPMAVQPDAAKRLEAADIARRNLAEMLTDAREYRLELLARMRELIGQQVLEPATRPARWHAFQLPDEAAAELMASFDAVTETLLEVEVLFDAKRHAAIERGYRAVIAEADGAFQGQLVQLLQPNPALLDGGTR